MNLIKNNWNKQGYQNFIIYLKDLKDIKYKKFHQSLFKENLNIIGIRTPILKKIAKNIKNGNYQSFLKEVTFTFYEETIIYAFIIGNIKKLDKETIKYINIYKTKIDNWAACDLFCSNLKIIKKNKEYFYSYIKKNIKINKEYIQRMCFVLLLNYYIEPTYLNDIFSYCDKYCNNTYYVNMSIAWLISYCYIKYKSETLKYLEKSQLDKETHNKALSKIIDSKRISKEEKQFVKTLKRD